jgi:uncharacterized protein
MVLPKRTMLRLVRTTAGVQVDPTGKLSGRGAYLHNVRACWEKGLKGPLSHALKVDLTEDDLNRLRQVMLSLPEENEAAGE